MFLAVAYFARGVLHLVRLNACQAVPVSQLKNSMLLYTPLFSGMLVRYGATLCLAMWSAIRMPREIAWPEKVVSPSGREERARDIIVERTL